MSDINQVLGIDASSALAALDKLDQGFKVFSGNVQKITNDLNAFNQVAGVATKNFRSMATATNNLTQSMSTLAQSSSGFAASTQSAATASASLASSTKATGSAVSSANNAIVAGKNAVQELTVSFETLKRVVATQFIVRLMSQARDAIRLATREAIEFERAVARINTIAGPEVNFAEIAQGARQLSDSFNVPLLETTEGLYQAISNQVGDLGESLLFTEEAARFAKATNSTLADSVDLLSGALKSYGLAANDVSKVSSLFFTVIDKGRITADELANTFGRVGPVAADLGVDIEEVGAALASISVRGTKTSEALTQLRGILNALQKPSVAMRKALREIGFSSSEAAIQALGLPEVLRQLNATTQGSSERLAQLFLNVRALSGASALLGDDLTSLASNIEAMKDQARDFNKEKFLQVAATDAEKVTSEFNKLKNALITGVGQGLLDVGSSFFDAIGGAETLIKTGEALTDMLGGLALALAATRIGVDKMDATLGTAGASFARFLALIPLAMGAGSAIGDVFGDKLLEDVRNLQKAQAAANKIDFEEFQKVQTSKRDAADATTKAVLDGIRQTQQEASRLYLAEEDAALRASTAIASNTKAAADQILNTRNRLVEELRKGVSETTKIAQEATNRIEALQLTSQERDFRFRIEGLNDAQQVIALLQRAQDLSRQAQAGFKGARTEEEVKKAVSLFDQAQKIGSEAQSLAQKAGDRGLEVRAFNELNTLTTRQIEAEKQLARVQLQRSQALDQERARQQGVADSLRNQLKILTQNVSLFDKEGNRLSEQQLDEQFKRRQEALQNIAKTATEGALDVGTLVNVADFVTRFQSDLDAKSIQLRLDADPAIAEVKQKLEDAFANFKVGVGGGAVSNLEAILGQQFRSPDEVAEGLGKAAAKATALRAEISKAQEASFQLAQAQKTLESSTAQAVDNLKNGGPVSEEFSNAVTAVAQKFQQLSQDANLTKEQVVQMKDFVAQLFQGINNSPNLLERIAGQQELLNLTSALDQLNKISQLRDAAGADTEALRTQLQSIEATLGSFTVAEQFEQSRNAIEASVLPSEQIRQNMEAAASAFANIGAPTGRLFGGMVPRFLAAGGRGMDTVPTMLDPREFVVSAKGSQSFFSQLQAINAGARPNFRQDGGQVTNVGDISINVNGAQSPHATARETITAIRRELRRGSSRI